MRRLLLLFLLTGCTKSQLVDVAMSGAERPAPAPHHLRVGGYEILAGDMHCHVLPPDAPYHVARQLPSTLELAKKENLDFVVLTPHVPRRFFADPVRREWVLRTQAELRAQLARLHPDILAIPGFEYTDFEFGHVGLSFADPAEVLAELPGDALVEQPERFFERWLAHGGFLTINHPLYESLPTAPFQELRYDMSWRVFVNPARLAPPEVAFITAHAGAIESYNASVTHLRDQFLLGDQDRSLRMVAALVDHESRRQHRKIAAVGGSDSHGEWLRATTFVLAKERTIPALRDGLANARTCVRGPEACTLQAHAREDSRDATWAIVGDSLSTAEAVLDVRVAAEDVSYVVNGAVVAETAPGTIPIPQGRCAVVRAIAGRSWSSGIFVNCQF